MHQRLNIYCPQFMQIYLGNNSLYSFDWQRARYIATNLLDRQKYQKHNKNNMEHKDNALAKG